jgi:hypothetical protein
MNSRERVNHYLTLLESRLRWQVILKGAAIALGVALGATIALVLITNALAFSSTSLVFARIALFIALAVSLGMALVLPLLALNRRRTAGRAEQAFPQFEERLVTYVERAGQNDPMLELLAADTEEMTRRATPETIIPKKKTFGFATAAGAAGAVLIWLIMAGPGFLGYGASLLWAGAPRTGGSSFYDITVDPGNKLVRRRSDQNITATLVGFQSPVVRLMARYKSSSKWEEARMLPRANGSAYEFLFAGLPEPVDYYVEAAGVKSKTYTLDVVDLPGIKKIKVTYHYPSWLGQADTVEDPGGDLRAVVGTTAELTIETDRPLKNGAIELEDGSHIKLESLQGNMLSAKVPIQKDGLYHFAGVEQGQSVRLSEDYFIEAREDSAPSVKIARPGADAKVSPIEEVTVAVEGGDDFGLSEMDLHYSVNGSPEKTVNMLQAKGSKQATGQTLISLEDFNLQAGDVVSLYATAKDARTLTRTDMVFIETQPFEKNYSQSQQGGGGGGGGGQQEQDEISKRQKEIIAATNNAIRGGPKDRSATAENAEFLSEVQAKLKQQAESLAQRATSRELAGANQEFQAFVKEMQAAGAEMQPASDKLKAQQWKEALVPEQKALQHLLRAEATFRDIQVAFGQQGGGGGGGGAGRDLANLFDLELDTEKNQYEQGQQQSSSEQRQKDVDEALQKLEQLAKRQQALADQQQKQNKQSFDQKWQQEMLRRDAEELKKQMEQLSRSGGQQSQSQSQQQGQSKSGQSGQSSSSGKQGQQGQQSNSAQGQQQLRQQNASERQLQQTLDSLDKAIKDMQNAQKSGQQGSQGQSAADARRAAEFLKESQDKLSAGRRQDANSQLNDLADRADKLAQQQHDFENRLRQQFGDAFADRGKNPQPTGTRAQAEQMAAEKDRMRQDLERLEKDTQGEARQLSNSQPNAASRLRDGLSAIQQNEAKLRMQAQSQYLRNGQGAYVAPREAPITQALDQLSDDIKQAQQAMGNGNQQQQARNDLDHSVNQVERLRDQMERLAGRNPGGQQPGDQQGQGQQGQGQQGQGQQGGNQPGNQGGASRVGGGFNNGQINAGNRFGGPNGGAYDPRLGNGRFNNQGAYDLPDQFGVPNTGQVARDAARELNELRMQFKDDPDVLKQITDLEREVQRLETGDTAGPELQQRLNRTILPNLETLEVQLRRQAEEKGNGQVRSGSMDKVPAGYTDAVAEYFRKLSRGK